ncbi:hypothetical protein CQ056_21135 [Peribacillus simplex]|nr:hypothetical protein CQ056_21135 [Peribacillus simplex]
MKPSIKLRFIVENIKPKRQNIKLIECFKHKKANNNNFIHVNGVFIIFIDSKLKNKYCKRKYL